MAVTPSVGLTLIHSFPSTSTFFFIRRTFGLTRLREPLPRDENEDDAVDVVCSHCGATVLVRYGSMASVRRAQARWNVILALCVVVMIASISFFVSQAGKVLPEGTPLSPFFPLSALGVAVAFVLGGFALKGRKTQRVAAIGPDVAPHSATGWSVASVPVPGAAHESVPRSTVTERDTR